MEPALAVIATLAGLIVGSFLNVVIWRLPRGESLMRPGSRCPGCHEPIRWYDNVPVLAWLRLRGRCAHCGEWISARYPLVEALTGGLFLLAYLVWGHHLPTAIFVSLVLAALLAASFIDWDHKIIPDRITKPGIVLAVALAPATILHPPDWIAGLKPALAQWLHAGTGALVGGLVILGVRWLGHLVFRKEAMGLGDVKLLAFIGATTGPVRVLYALVIACLAGAIIGGLRLLWARNRPMRFPLEVRGKELREVFGAARVEPETLTVVAADPAPVDADVVVKMRLPAAGILEDDDAEIEMAGRVEETAAVPGGHAWRVAVTPGSELDAERLALFAASLRYVPFGPFLALGGATTLLFGKQVHWLIAEGYPGWAQSLFR